MKKLRNWLLFFLIVLIWSSNWSVMKRGLVYVEPLRFVFHRFLISSLSLLPAAILLSQKIPRKRRDLVGLIFLGMINAFGILSTNIGLAAEQSGLSAVVTYTQPLFVFCMAVPLLGEKAKLERILGIIIGFLGVVAISTRGETLLEGLTSSILFLLGGAFLWAVSIIYYKKILSHIEPVITNVFQMSIGALILGLVAAPSGGLGFPTSMSYLLILLYASVGASALAFTIWIHLLREEEATVLSSSSLIVPMFALFFGWLLLGETVDPQSLAGAILVILGVYLVNKS
jgi:drug/metabolite transporter (DMT)-like permease